jgi:hypothetical protein
MLQIDRLSLQVRSAAAPERAERLARRLRDAAVSGIERNRIAGAPPGSPAYLFVDRLAFACMVSSDWDDATIGAAVARALAGALARSLELEETVAFRDRTELLAAFYSALAEGRAWERWWFEEFDGLKALAASAALRTSLINERDDGVAALARLTEHCFCSVMAVLSAGDARRLLEWFTARHASARVPVLSLWKASAALVANSSNAVATLRAVLALERTTPGAAGRETLRALQAMAALRTAALRGELDLPRHAGSAIAIDLRDAAAKLAIGSEWLEALGEDDAGAISDELICLAAGAPPSETASEQANPVRMRERLFTPHGGAFVLLKALDWLGWPRSWASSGPGRDELVRALSWALAVRALVPHGARQALSDPVLHAAFGLEQPLAVLKRNRREATQALNQRSIVKAADELLAQFASRVPGLAGASAGYLRRNALALPASVELHGERCVVRLGRAPLDVLLVLAGAKTGRIALPGGPTLELRAEGGA